jgi:hypothetical protein
VYVQTTKMVVVGFSATPNSNWSYYLHLTWFWVSIIQLTCSPLLSLSSISLPFSDLSMVAQMAASPTGTVPIFETQDSQSDDYITGFWDVAPCTSVSGEYTSNFRVEVSNVPPKSWQQPIRIHGLTSQKTAVLKRHIVRIYLPNNNVYAIQAEWLCRVEYEVLHPYMPDVQPISTDYLVNITGELKRSSSTSFCSLHFRNRRNHVSPYCMSVGPSVFSTPDSSIT